jgi:hypothetical protein
MAHFHSSDARAAKRLWLELGGRVAPVRRTGETEYTHPAFDKPLRLNGRRNDVPMVLLLHINKLIKTHFDGRLRVSDDREPKLAWALSR